MSASDAPRALPARPSEDHLRKLAKRLARTEGVKIAAAQARLAHEHGLPNWATLIRAVRAKTGGRSPLSEAAARTDEAAARDLLAGGAAVDGDDREPSTPLLLACGAEGAPEHRLAVARMLLEAGAFVRTYGADGSTPLHAAARTGPIELVELLLRHGALAWQTDGAGRRPEEAARNGAPLDREKILAVLADGPKIADPTFRAAVMAIQSGDEVELARLLDARPALLTERAIEPSVIPRGYFSDPKLFWFIANNPTLIPRSPPNLQAVARLMIARGVEAADLTYALELVMTNGQMTAEEQIGLSAVLVEAGAETTRQGLLMTLGHGQTAVVAWLVGNGRPLDAATAAGLGRTDALPGLLARATPTEVHDALALAVINHRPEAVRMCLDAGADPSAFMPVHAHSTPLHQAALDGDLETMTLLVEAGARLDTPDALWRGTPLGWATHGGQKAAEAFLRARLGSENPSTP